MTLAADLDTWTTTLGTACSLPATRDPAKVYPPCLFVGLPDTTGGTLPTIAVDLPVFLVAAGAGKPAGDQLLGYLPTVLAALKAKAATAETLTLDGVDYHAYRIQTPLYVTL